MPALSSARTKQNRTSTQAHQQQVVPNAILARARSARLNPQFVTSLDALLSSPLPYTLPLFAITLPSISPTTTTQNSGAYSTISIDSSKSRLVHTMIDPIDLPPLPTGTSLLKLLPTLASSPPCLSSLATLAPNPAPEPWGEGTWTPSTNGLLTPPIGATCKKIWGGMMIRSVSVPNLAVSWSSPPRAGSRFSSGAVWEHRGERRGASGASSGDGSGGKHGWGKRTSKSDGSNGWEKAETERKSKRDGQHGWGKPSDRGGDPWRGGRW
jgi:hypothetical protein